MIPAESAIVDSSVAAPRLPVPCSSPLGWVVVGVAGDGSQARIFGSSRGRGFQSRDAANRALHAMRRRRPDLSFVLSEWAAVPAMSLDTGPCPGCGAQIGLRNGVCHREPGSGQAAWQVPTPQVAEPVDVRCWAAEFVGIGGEELGVSPDWAPPLVRIVEAVVLRGRP
jgi:hypothetical protein